MSGGFTPFHRGGSGPPLVLVHGFTDTWRTWELVLPALERRFDVLAPTLPGHAGGPPLPDELTEAIMAEAVEEAMDAAGFETAHVVGNSLGGQVALQLASRGRARSVTAFAPAGGWADGDDSYKETLAHFRMMLGLLPGAVPHVDALVASPEGRRNSTLYITVNFEHIPAELIAHQILGAAACVEPARRLIDSALSDGWALPTDPLPCPARIVWGTEDRLLVWPGAAARFREPWMATADWQVLDDVGHCPQLDVPAVAAELIAEFARDA